MKQNSLLPAYLALAVVCLVWGTTYFAIRVGVEHFPPFLFSGIRQVIAGGIMLLVLKISGKLQVHRSDIINQSVLGLLMVALGNGVIGWSERFISSGLAALICSLIPVFVVVISFVLGFDRQKQHILIIVGLLLGCMGIALIFRDNLADLTNKEYFTGMLVAFGACLAWAYGSVISKYRLKASSNIFQSAALQLFTGGLVLFVLSALLDDYSELQYITPDSIWALVYLIVVGSLIAYTAFVYALKHLPIGISSLYAYINPLIALVLGAALLNEKMTAYTFFALLTTLAGVYCINRGYQLMARAKKQ